MKEKRPKQERYLDNDGELDYLDRTMKTMTPAQFRGAMMWTIGKYIDRIEKKDDIEREVYKIADYAQRWYEYEVSLSKNDNELADFDLTAFNIPKPDGLIPTPRIDIIGQNGEHHEEM